MSEVVGMLLCAGLGTRLRPLTTRVPKPAAPVCGEPLVRFSLALLHGAGLRRAVVNVHHLPEAMEASARESAAALGMELAISREPVIAGTGGALREARARLAGADTILLVNGDVLFDADLAGALSAHRAAGALATMVLLPMPEGGRYAAVEMDGAGAVRRIAGAFGPGGDALVPWHFSGVHVLSPSMLDRVFAEPFEQDVNRHVYPPLMALGAVRGFVASGYWNDLGTPARYLAANQDLLYGRVPLGRFPRCDPFDGMREIAPGVHVAREARIEKGALLQAPALVGEGTSIEAGAEVGPGAVLGARCVIGAGAHVRDAVVWDDTVIVPGENVVGAIAAGGERVSATHSEAATDAPAPSRR